MMSPRLKPWLARVGIIFVACSFFLSATLPWLISAQGPVWCEKQSGLGHLEPVTVVVEFTVKDINSTLHWIKSFDRKRPCTGRGIRAYSTLVFYGDADVAVNSAVGVSLRATVGHTGAIGDCFSQVFYLSQASQRKFNGTADSRGFYSLVLEALHEGSLKTVEPEHLLYLQPSVRLRKEGWLERVILEATRSPYWVQGSAYRGKCVPGINGNKICSWLGASAVGHVSKNSLYHVGDPTFLSFLEEVQKGPYEGGAFEKALYQHMTMVWPEHKYRRAMHLYQQVDWIQDFGRYPFEEDEVPSHVVLLHTEKPTLTHHYTDNQVAEPESSTEEADRYAVELASLKQEVAGGEIEPPPKDPELLKMLQFAANKNKQVVLSFASEEYRDFLDNFLYFMNRIGMGQHVLVVPLDSNTESMLKAIFKEKRIGAFLTLKQLTGGGFDKEKGVQSLRAGIIARCLKQGYKVLSSDLDVAWLANPFLTNMFADDFDIQIATDSRTSFREGVPEGVLDPYVSPGLFYTVPSPHSIRLFERLSEAFQNSKRPDKREVISAVLRRNRLGLRWRVLEPALFPNGYLYFDQTYAQALGVRPIAVHNNYADNPLSKVYRFREYDMWFKDKELANTVPGNGKKYMTFLDVIYENGLGNKRQALREALGICQLLNRTLILPVFHREHGEDSPVVLDYFFSWSTLLDHFPNVEPRSFLRNAFPHWETLPVHDIDIGLGLPGNYSKTGQWQDVSWLKRLKQVKASYTPNGAAEMEILKWYGESTEQLLVFYNTFRRFGKFADEAVHREFDERAYHGITARPRTLEIKDQVFAAFEDAVSKTAGGETYNCLHVRRTDFMVEHDGREKSVEEIVQLVTKYLSKNVPLYVTTDDPSEEMRDLLKGIGYPIVYYLNDLFPKWEWPYVLAPNGRVTMRHGQIDQQVCSRAEMFVGNEYSTFTFHIAYLRLKLGKKQLTQDIYSRVKPEGMMYM